MVKEGYMREREREREGEREREREREHSGGGCVNNVHHTTPRSLVLYETNDSRVSAFHCLCVETEKINKIK